jgi:hypothetical protein
VLLLLLLLLLPQLTKERRDLVTHLRSDIINRIRDMPAPVALHVLGELNDLPRGWQAGLGKQQQPAQHLAAVVARAEAYARDVHRGGSSSAAAGDGWGDGDYGEGDGGWVTAGKEAGRGGAGLGPNNSSSNGQAVGSSSSSNVGVSGTPASLMAQLQSKRPDIWSCMCERHRKLISPLTAEQQKKVCAGLGVLTQ